MYEFNLNAQSPEIVNKDRCPKCYAEFKIGDNVTFEQVGFGMDVTVHCDCEEEKK